MEVREIALPSKSLILTFENNLIPTAHFQAGKNKKKGPHRAVGTSYDLLAMFVLHVHVFAFKRGSEQSFIDLRTWRLPRASTSSLVLLFSHRHHAAKMISNFEFKLSNKIVFRKTTLSHTLKQNKFASQTISIDSCVMTATAPKKCDERRKIPACDAVFSRTSFDDNKLLCLFCANVAFLLPFFS